MQLLQHFHVELAKVFNQILLTLNNRHTMKKYLLNCLLATTILACTPENAPSPACHFCDLFPTGTDAAFAEGEITQQNAGPRQQYEVLEAAVTWIEDNVFSVKYFFHTNDSLEIVIAEATQDFNYHFPKPTDQNQILEVYFNEEFLELKDAALSLQPRPDEGGFHTVVNVHTLHFGDWNGTVNKVPFLE